jgi:hypothetical protein
MVYIYTAWILGHKPDFSNKVDKATQTEEVRFKETTQILISQTKWNKLIHY